MKYRFWGWLLLLGIIVNGLLKSKDEDGAVAVIGLTIWLIMIIIFGIQGRSIAWKSRIWKNEKEFINTQRKWDIWGIIIFILLNTIFYMIPTNY